MKSFRPSSSANPGDQNDTDSLSSGEPVFLAIGQLRRSHGVKGEIGMEVMTDFPERVHPNNTVFVGPKHLPQKIITVRWNNRLMLVSFEGFTDCDQVSILRNQIVYVRTENVPTLPEGEYYYHQLIGLKVVDESGQEIGKLEEILETGSNDVYRVQSGQGEEILLPATEEVIRKVDLAQGIVIVRPPEWD